MWHVVSDISTSQKHLRVASRPFIATSSDTRVDGTPRPDPLGVDQQSLADGPQAAKFAQCPRRALYSRGCTGFAG
jgi:hypothetical protein